MQTQRGGEIFPSQGFCPLMLDSGMTLLKAEDSLLQNRDCPVKRLESIWNFMGTAGQSCPCRTASVLHKAFVALLGSQAHFSLCPTQAVQCNDFLPYSILLPQI